MRGPVVGTILFGLACAIIFFPITVFLDLFVTGLGALCITLWVFVAFYGVLLAKWAKKRLWSVLFPLAILFASIGFLPLHAFLLFGVIILAWIRSGVCFPEPPMSRLFAELAIGFGAGVLVSALSPSSWITWAGSIWLFFLVQSVFFLIFPLKGAVEKKALDSFDSAYSKAMKILEN